MRKTVLALIATIAVVFVAITVHRATRLINDLQLGWGEEAIRLTVDAEVRRIRSEMALWKMRSEALLSGTQENWAKLPGVDAVMRWDLAGSPSQSVLWRAREGTPFAKEPASRWQGLLRDRAHNLTTGFSLQRLSVPEAPQFYLLSVRDGRQVTQFLLNQNPFLAVTGTLGGAISELIIGDESGLILSHSESAYVGASFRDSPVFTAVSSAFGESGAAVIPDGRKVFFQRVPETGFVVIASSSAKAAGIPLGRWATGLFVLGIALVLIVASVLVLVQRDEQKKPEAARAADVQKTPQVVNFDSDSRLEVFRKIAASLGQEINGPLLSIIARAQGLQGVLQDPKILADLEVILREARGLRGQLEKLISFSGENFATSEVQTLSPLIVAVLKELEPQLKSKEIKVIREFDESVSAIVNNKLFSNAVRELITNAMEALERKPSKEIRIRLHQAADETVQLTVSDNGEGMDQTTVARAKDPFFTTRSWGRHAGLGLCLVEGVAKELGGRLEIRSEFGRGTDVSIIFPKVRPEHKTPERPVLQPEAVHIPCELPPVTEDDLVKLRSSGNNPAEVDIDSLLELPAEMPSILESKSQPESNTVEAEPDLLEGLRKLSLKRRAPSLSVEDVRRPRLGDL